MVEDLLTIRADRDNYYYGSGPGVLLQSAFGAGCQ